MNKVIVAKAFLINPEGLILALRRSGSDKLRPLTWDLPGGGVEDAEDPKDAVIRETEEEAGIKLIDPQVFVVKTSSDKVHVIRILYYAKVKNNDIKLSFEHDQFKWLSKAEYKQLDMPQRYKDCIDLIPNNLFISTAK